jgi:hypothetical protein
MDKEKREEGTKREWEEERECRGSGYEDGDDGKTETVERRGGQREKEGRT